MGYFAPTFIAFLMNACGVNIFHESSKPGCEPLVSCLVFMFSVFLLLWDIRLLPSGLRRIGWRGATYVVHFFIAAFLMEHFMNDFWFPLEATLLGFLPKVAEFEEDVLRQSGLKYTGIFQFLKSELASVVGSYILSFFFLFAVLHCTRIVDFRLIKKNGFAFFWDDFVNRMRRASRRFKRIFTNPRNVQFQLEQQPAADRNGANCPLRRYLLEDSDFDEPLMTARIRRRNH